MHGHQGQPQAEEHEPHGLLSVPLSAWPQIASRLNAQDLLRLSLGSKSLRLLLASIPGFWQQACDRHLAGLGADAGTSTAQPANSANPSTSDSISAWTCGSDAAGLTILTAASQLQHLCIKHHLLLRPMVFRPPPWLSGMPGRSRSFLPVVDGGAGLVPPLLMSEQQAYWLRLGCPVEHVNGVFVSSCTASPRTGAACAAAILVVLRKQLVAELYLRSSGAASGPWATLDRVPVGDGAAAIPHRTSCPTAAAAAAREGGGADSATSSTSSSSSSSCASHAPVELWLHSSLLHHPAAAEPPAAGPRVPSRSIGQNSIRRSVPGGRPAVASVVSPAAAGVPLLGARHAVAAASPAGAVEGEMPSSEGWQQVQQMIHSCICSNITRARAMSGTSIVMPATPAAIGMEACLQQLKLAGLPVCDLRMCLADACMLAYSSSRAAQEPPQLPQQEVVAAATGTASTDWDLIQHHITQGMANSLQQHMHSAAALVGEEDGTHAAAAEAGEGLDDPDFPEAGNSSSSSSPDTQHDVSAPNSSRARISNDFLGELLRVVLQRLPRLAPATRLLVLPILLPGGPAGSGRGTRQVRGKSSYGSGVAFSAPKLLSINVPFLMPLKECWEQLPWLQQVALVVSAGPTVVASGRSASSQPAAAADGAPPGSISTSNVATLLRSSTSGMNSSSDGSGGGVSSTVADAVRSLVASCLDRLGPIEQGDSEL